MKTIRIGTRKSALALWQAEFVAAKLRLLYPEYRIEFVKMVSQGDRLIDTPLASAGGKGLFLKELEEALINNSIDIAVHSMKDVPVHLPDGLTIAVVCEREDPRDVLVSSDYQSLSDLPDNARIGTCSLRRRCQLLAYHSNWQVLDLRGNVNTRLQKLDDGQYDAIILAAAGLKRLQLNERIQNYLPTDHFIPAVGQGIVGIECRSDDTQIKRLLQPLSDRKAEICIAAERRANALLEGGCHAPLGVHAFYTAPDQITLTAMVGALDGSKVLYESAIGSVSDVTQLAERVTAVLLERGAGNILAGIA